MKIALMTINNFRGIQSGAFYFPLNQRIFCIIGPGDSCKSTLLKAVEWCLWPTWNLYVTDLDFYNGDTTSPIIIEMSVAEIPGELLTEDKFGLYLRNFGAVAIGAENDEPVDNETSVITIRLTIDNTLEPVWSIISNRTDPRPITQKDRRYFSFGLIGFEYEKDFVWGRTSVLQLYGGTSRDALHTAYKEAMRAAVEKADLTALDGATTEITNIGKEYGVRVAGELSNRLLMQNGSYSTNVGIFEGKVPFIQRGLGSKRLLSMGLNIRASSDGSLILIDEIETGLEPYRLCTLINQLRAEFTNQGQLIFTTHSRSAVCECRASELFIINEINGRVSLFPVAQQDALEEVQSLIRTEPDAFLCKRIIVCEGKTEVGILRAFDDYLYKCKKFRFAYNGVGTALGGGGNKFFKLAKLLKKCGYDVCILMDSDLPEEETQKSEMEALGIKVFSWETGNSIEEQIFHDSNPKCAEELIALAIENKGYDSVKARLINDIENAEAVFIFGDDSITFSKEVKEDVLISVGRVSKGKWNEKKKRHDGGWYKRIDLGQAVGEIIFQSGRIKDGSKFMETMNALGKWVKANDP